MRRITQHEALLQAKEVAALARDGAYTSASGRRVPIREAIVDATARTAAWPPEREPSRPGPGGHETRIRVVRATTLEAARTLASSNQKPVALNFANAVNPGGGFLVGALAQEESLCRASGLYFCLVHQPLYAYHRKRGGALYTDYVLYSPDVPVFRGEDGGLLDEPWSLAFLTAAAPFAHQHLQMEGGSADDLEPAFRSRIAKVLGVAAYHGHASLVLGAWGCGAFGNDPVMVAACFREALVGDFRDVFEEVLFAITDDKPGRRVLRAFEGAFAS